MRRFIVLLAALAASMFAWVGVGAMSPANAADATFTRSWNGAGSEWLPCEGGILTWQFDLAGPSMASSATLSVNGTAHTGVQTGDFSWSFTSPGDGVTTSSDVFVTYTAEHELFESAVSIVSCDSYETPTTTPPTETVPTTSTPPSSPPTETVPTTQTVPTHSTPPASTLPTQSSRPVPTEIEAGVAGPTPPSGQGPSPLLLVGLAGGLTLAGLGAWTLTGRRGRHLG